MGQGGENQTKVLTLGDRDRWDPWQKFPITLSGLKTVVAKILLKMNVADFLEGKKNLKSPSLSQISSLQIKNLAVCFLINESQRANHSFLYYLGQ